MSSQMTAKSDTAGRYGAVEWTWTVSHYPMLSCTDTRSVHVSKSKSGPKIESCILSYHCFVLLLLSFLKCSCWTGSTKQWVLIAVCEELGNEKCRLFSDRFTRPCELATWAMRLEAHVAAADRTLESLQYSNRILSSPYRFFWGTDGLWYNIKINSSVVSRRSAKLPHCPARVYN